MIKDQERSSYISIEMVAEFKLDEEESVPEDVNATIQGESHEMLSDVSDGNVLVLVWDCHLHPIVCH